MSRVQRVAQVFGWVFIVVAAAGFVMAPTAMDADMENAPWLFGLFPVNLLHNLVHLLFGAWGVLAARSWDAAKRYCVVGGAAYLLLAVLGLVTPTLFGLVPIGGNDVWLHALFGLALVGAGVTARAPVVERTLPL